MTMDDSKEQKSPLPTTAQEEIVVIARVRPKTDVAKLARTLADHSRGGATIIMYPPTPFH